MGLLLAAPAAEAFALGIALDAFLNTLLAAFTGLGMLTFVGSGIAWGMSMMDNQYGHALTGMVPLFFRGGIMGGLVTMGGVLGLSSGAVLLGV
jgi:hypothetical protein